jgi:hypothetical protein
VLFGRRTHVVDGEALSEVRAKAQAAQSRARLAGDPQSKQHWEEQARELMARLAELEAQGKPTRRSLA